MIHLVNGGLSVFCLTGGGTLCDQHVACIGTAGCFLYMDWRAMLWKSGGCLLVVVTGCPLGSPCPSRLCEALPGCRCDNVGVYYSCCRLSRQRLLCGCVVWCRRLILSTLRLRVYSSQCCCRGPGGRGAHCDACLFCSFEPVGASALPCLHSSCHLSCHVFVTSVVLVCVSLCECDGRSTRGAQALLVLLGMVSTLTGAATVGAAKQSHAQLLHARLWVGRMVLCKEGL